MEPPEPTPEPRSPVTRRTFLRRTCRGALAAALAGGTLDLAGCDSAGGEGLPDGVVLEGNMLTIDTTLTPALSRSDGVLWLPDADVIVIHDDQGGYRAFSSVCPHERKQVRSFDGSELRCPAHGWTFDVDGAPTGSARRGLTRFPLAENGTVLTVDLS